MDEEPEKADVIVRFYGVDAGILSQLPLELKKFAYLIDANSYEYELRGYQTVKDEEYNPNGPEGPLPG